MWRIACNKRIGLYVLSLMYIPMSGCWSTVRVHLGVIVLRPMYILFRKNKKYVNWTRNFVDVVKWSHRFDCLVCYHNDICLCFCILKLCFLWINEKIFRIKISILNAKHNMIYALMLPNCVPLSLHFYTDYTIFL